MNNIFAFGTLNYIWSHPNNQVNRIASVAKFIGWQLYKRLVNQHLDIQFIPGIKLRCYPDSRSASAALYCGLYDYAEMTFLSRYLRPEDTFIDVGANIGVYTLLAASIIKSGSIHSIEALPRNCDRLRENITLNQLQQVHLYPIAVSNTQGHIWLNIADEDSMSFITNQITEKVIRVPTNTLDNLLNIKSSKALALGKMDIEGAELFALQGATSLLQMQSPPVWILEVLDSTDSSGCQQQDIEDFLQAYGYHLYSYDVSSNHLSSLTLESKTGNNVLAIADSALAFVRARLTQTSMS